MAVAPSDPTTDVPILAHRQLRSQISGNFVEPALPQDDDYFPGGIPQVQNSDETPLSWDDLLNTPHTILASQFKRSRLSAQLVAAVDMARQASYESFAAKICAEFLDVPTIRSASGRKDVSIENVRNASLVLNLYPYHVEKGIWHYCIFATYDISEQSIQSICESACGEDVEYVLFKHENNLRPVTGGLLRTFHVFVRNKTETDVRPQVDAIEGSPRKRFAARPFFRQVSDELSDPMAWDTLAEASRTEEGIRGIAHTFTRRRSVNLAYKTFREELAQHFVDVGSKIKTVDLGLPGSIDEDGRVFCQVPPGLKKHSLFLNDFPYYLESGVKHYVLFATYVMEQDEIDAVLQEQLPEYDFLFHENPPHLQSIPELWHVQVFARERQ